MFNPNIGQHISLSQTSFTEGTVNSVEQAELQRIGAHLEAKLSADNGITLLPKIAKITQTMLRQKFPEGPITFCDAYIEGIELGEEHEWGYSLNQIRNVDHHAPRPIMRRFISSGVQAGILVALEGTVPEDQPVVINHTDCDSIISSATMRGLIPPHPAFCEAVICADHTAAPNRIAEVLQALEPAQNLALSLHSLAALLLHKELPAATRPYLERSEREQQTALDAVQNKRFIEREGVVLVQTPIPVESSFVGRHFPHALAVINTYPRPIQPSGSEKILWDVKLRLGADAPQGFSLDTIGIKDLDPQFGGRWNAGSTSRSGGTYITGERYMNHIIEQLRAFNAAARAS